MTTVASYLRTVSTYIPRLVWPNKPVFGREQWIKRLDRRLGIEARCEFRRARDWDLGATTSQRRLLGDSHRAAVAAVMIRTGLRILSAPRWSPLGPGLVVAYLLQRLVHGRRGRPLDLVLLQLGLYHAPTVSPAVVRQHVFGPRRGSALHADAMTDPSMT